MDTRPTPQHVYLSTGCLHGNHPHCRNDHTASGVPKKPHTCKFCDAECICPCHRGELTRSGSDLYRHDLLIDHATTTFITNSDGEINHPSLLIMLEAINNALAHSGNPWGDEQPPAALEDSYIVAHDITVTLRNLR